MASHVVKLPDRDELQKRLQVEGVDTLIHYPIPPHMQAAYSGLRLAPDLLPIARQLADEVLSLPIGPQLQQCEFNRVIQAIRQHGLL